MKRSLGPYLRQVRGPLSRNKFADLLGLSYTFVRALEFGHRLPSDEVIARIAARSSADPRRLLLYTHCDRSPGLKLVLQTSDLAELWESDGGASEGESG